MGMLNVSTRVHKLLRTLPGEIILKDETGAEYQQAATIVTVYRNLAPNWIGILPRTTPLTVDVGALGRVVDEGTPVAWIPRPAILSDFMLAETAQLGQLVLAHETEILDDCAKVIDASDTGLFPELAQLLGEALDAARNDHHSAAQALAANVLDSLLRIAFPLGQWQGYRKMRRAISSMRSGKPSLTRLRTALAFAPILLATDEYPAGSGAVPNLYNRHATAHAVGHVQYTRLNSVVALMIATSTLRECRQPRPDSLPRAL